VVLKALEREPARRYQQVSEVKTGVETITSTMPQEKKGTAAPEAFKSQPPTRLSRMALAGAACLLLVIGVFVNSLVFDLYEMPQQHQEVSVGQDAQGRDYLTTASGLPGPPKSWRIAVFTSVMLAIVGVLGMTACGWLAVTQIRHSAGTIYGLGLALFDGLFFPLLFADVPIFLLVGYSTASLLKLVGVSPRYLDGSGVIAAFLFLVLFDFFIVRKVCRICRAERRTK
jgi:hypothetical protein